VNSDSPIDLVSLALLLGATFVARGFSGDKHQLVPLLKAAIAHKGSAILDVISPCVQFNNNPESTKSYDFVREHNDAVNRIDFIVPKAEITVDYTPGSVETVRQHDGSIIKLAKLRNDYNPHDRAGAMAFCQAHAAKGEVVTGLLYIEDDAQDLHAHLNTVATPLNKLGEADLCPGAKALDTINASYR
jgi:2-oxoglutarate/2-oxoacid ferredoxin oxidoreductase subunit beta